MADVVMPQMGESIFEGTITKWLKKPGDKVERDEPLFEISTDKVDAEIPAPAAGVLREIKVAEGKTVPIQTVVAVIDVAGAAPAPQAQPGTTTPQSQPKTAAPQDQPGTPTAQAQPRRPRRRRNQGQRHRKPDQQRLARVRVGKRKCSRRRSHWLRQFRRLPPAPPGNASTRVPGRSS